MSVIRGFAELRANPDMDAERWQTFSDLILEDVDRFLSMTQELSDYSRGNISLQAQEVEVGRWLDRIIGYLRENLDASKVVLITRCDHRGPVHIDADRLRRVIINIAGNAADAMPKGGRLTISSRVVGDSWELAVTGTGTGIPEQLRPRIVEPFVTSGKEHGTGLGLAIAQEIVRGHGGDIQVETRTEREEEGRSAGSTFIISLPLSGVAAE